MRAFDRDFIDAAVRTTQLVTVGKTLYSFEPTPVQSPIWYPDLRVKRDHRPWGWVVAQSDGTYAIHVSEQPGDPPAKVGRGVTVEQAIRSAL